MSLSPNDPVEPMDRRIGDAERNAALSDLGEHLAAGRLDLTEYSDRAGKVTVARTHRELVALFVDLPDPKPTGPTTGPPGTRDTARAQVVPAAAYPPVPPPAPPVTAQDRAAKMVQLATSIAAVIAVILFFVVSRVWPMGWVVFLLVPLVALIAKVVYRDQL